MQRKIMLNSCPLSCLFSVNLAMMVSSIFACGGCATVREPDVRSDLMLAFALHHSDVDDQVWPFVLLVGDDEILASDRISWWIEVHDSDALLPQIIMGPPVSASNFRTHNPYYHYIAWSNVPDEPAHAYGVGHIAPVWIGPPIDSTILEGADRIRVNFSLHYYSRVREKLITRSYELPDIPIESNDFHMVPLEEGRILR